VAVKKFIHKEYMSHMTEKCQGFHNSVLIILISTLQYTYIMPPPNNL